MNQRTMFLTNPLHKQKKTNDPGKIARIGETNENTRTTCNNQASGANVEIALAATSHLGIYSDSARAYVATESVPGGFEKCQTMAPLAIQFPFLSFETLLEA